MSSKKPCYYEIDLLLSQTGRIRHIVKQADEEAAKTKIHRAYPKQEITILQLKELPS
ncbi:hypothetical protein PhaeoP23_03941 (plasmid) [Phaeobacter piscinae]|uniref:Uncharacterized protein n=1 Tax=Phaeobacter piscinae TaxID=1580596 RepID=A0ABN5DWR3_9RHOB|nr:hypothetical protein PhaeoP36_04019 [Phaeobacter piscinae]AUQ88615.1 hypothetical protein PhaeoP42_04020 [Phaeobacter piscinae]AUQ92604.1 hypothetical protein PhaeoP24_04046 [Phaeobacter inhibens]AUR26420.1 hypothetical protein PhaeoP23_03941 [Phaeobacter piscinae]